MDTMILIKIRDELSGIFTKLIGEEVHLSDEETQRVIEKLRPADVSNHPSVCSSSDLACVC